MGQKRDIVVVGAGLGGMTAIAQLASAWPRSLQVAIVIAFDARGQPPNAVLEILQNYAPFQMRYARDGEEIKPGRIYLGPPDAHAVVAAPGVIRFEPSAMFDTSCPSADRLFASAAAFYGERVIAVLLTGATHDGLRGIEHVERAGGIGIVQDPAEASAPTMPANVMRRNHPDYCIPVGRMAGLIAQLVEGDGD